MYLINTLVGKVVTIKEANGQEYIGKLVGVDEDKTILTLERPKVVAITAVEGEQQVFMLPFVLTADSAQVFFSTNNVLAVLETLEETAKEYNQILEEEDAQTKEDEKSEEVEVEVG